MNFEWIEIDKIVPNPLNPRKDYSERNEEMQRIIKDKGWETGISCYRKRSKYVILSGHRRWYAATQLKIECVPVYIVDQPRDEIEELERLGSVQGGKVDWSVYEWAKYTYDMWILWNKCSYKELSIKMNASETLIATRIRVFQYYPHNEIDEQLSSKIFSISSLYSLVLWLEKLTKEKPILVNQYKMDMIRKTMLRKMEKGLLTVNDLKNHSYLEYASDENIMNFLLDIDRSLNDAFQDAGEDSNIKNRSRINTHITHINDKMISLSSISSNKGADAKILSENLKELEEVILRKQDELRVYLR